MLYHCYPFAGHLDYFHILAIMSSVKDLDTLEYYRLVVSYSVLIWAYLPDFCELLFFLIILWGGAWKPLKYPISHRTFSLYLIVSPMT